MTQWERGPRPEFNACFYLRRALTAADAQCLDAEVGSDRLIHLQHLDVSTAARLCTLLQGSPAAAGPQRLDTLVMGRYGMSRDDIAAVRNGLRNALAELNLGDLPLRDTRQGLAFELGSLTVSGAEAFTAMLWSAMREHVTAARALHTTFRDRGLGKSEVHFEPDVHQLKITLGDISPLAAATIASALDGAPLPDDLNECPDYPELEQITDRLVAAVKTATSAGFVDIEAIPYCTRCCEGPVVKLADLTLDEAQQLIAALRSADASPLPARQP
uniref:hypothetical protein n=1 Tax=Streptomyces sp. CA-136453 TaxID=3240050 RepID=UPI003F493F4F